MTNSEPAEPCDGFWADTARVRADYLAEVPTQTLVLKVAEEVGEVAQAYIGMIGGNPRKGVHKSRVDVLDELADVMLAAAVPMVDLAGGAAEAERHLAERLGIVSAREVAPRSGSADGWHGSFIAPHVLLRRDDGRVLAIPPNGRARRRRGPGAGGLKISVPSSQRPFGSPVSHDRAAGRVRRVKALCRCRSQCDAGVVDKRRLVGAVQRLAALPATHPIWNASWRSRRSWRTSLMRRPSLFSTVMQVEGPMFRATPSARLSCGQGPLTAVAFVPDTASPDSGWLATAGEDGAVRLWVASERSLRCTYQHSRSHMIVAIDFSDDGALLATLANDGQARVWDTRSGQCIRTLDCHDEELDGEDELLENGAIALSGDGALLATNFAFDFQARVWETTSGRRVRTLREPGAEGFLTDLAFVPGQPSMLALLYERQGLRIWDMSDGRHVRSIGPLPGREFAAAIRFSRDGKLVAMAGHHVTIWDVNTGRGVLGGHTDDCGGSSGVDLSPDGGRLVTSGHSHGLGHVWDLSALIRETGFHGARRDVGDMFPYSALESTLDMVCGDVAFSPDGRLIAANVGDTAVVWRVGRSAGA